MSAGAVLAVARREIGTVESPANSNRTKYGRAYGMDGNAWCAMFTWWCFQEAGVGGLHPKSAYTPAIADWFRGRKRWGTKPQVGALVLFDFPGDGVNRISHIGIVETVHGDGTVTTIEGNTSSGTAGSQRNGGGVWRRRRRSGIVGYGYPAYDGAAPAASVPYVERTLLRRGDRGDDVRALQARLGTAADGIFGPTTEAALRAFQARHGLAVDGIAGPATWGKLNAPAPAPAARAGRSTIRRGSRGDDVAFVQRWLGLTADGIFGPATETAVRRYQSMRGIGVDGIVGPATWREMGQ